MATSTDKETLTGQAEPEEAQELTQPQEQADNAAPEAAEDQLQPLPDISAGDMETDLPTAQAPTSTEEQAPGEEVAPAQETTLEAESAPTEELEIPWGDVTLPEGEATEAEAPTAEPETATEPETAALAPAPEGQPAGATPYKHAWYVVHCYSGYENKVKKGLEQRIVSMGMQDRIYRVVVPVEKEVEIKEGQRRNIERRVFPGYILVEMMELQQGEPTSDEAWYVVRNTPGVTGFVSSGDKPVPLREEEVNKILKRMETAEPKVHVTFRTGQTVHIIDGPFADFRGTVDNVDMTKGKVRVLVSFFGRETPVELDLLQVEKV